MTKVYQPTWKSVSAEFGGDEKAMRKEYTRLRDIARKRLKRVESSEFKGFYSEYNAGGFAKLSSFTDKKHGIRDKGAFASELSKLSRFVSSPVSTVSGLREYRTKSIERLHKLGYDYINESNFKEFSDFMDRYRSLGLDEIYDSDEIIEDTYAVGEQKGVSPEDLLEEFAAWQGKQSALENYGKNNPAPAGTSSADLKKLLEML